MNIRHQILIAVFLIGGSIALSGCARKSPARVEIVAAEKTGVAAKADEAPAASRNGKFAFPADQGGPLLRELLGPPSRLASDAESKPGPRPQPIAGELAHPELPLAKGQADLPRRPLLSRGPLLQPKSPSEELPLSKYRADPKPASRQEMHGGAPVRVPSRDVSLPPALPILGVLTVDRVSLDDPTTAESSKAALAATPPVRTNPAPFVPRNLPDPFENGRTIKLPTSPVEEPAPSTGPVRPPKN